MLQDGIGIKLESYFFCFQYVEKTIICTAKGCGKAAKLQVDNRTTFYVIICMKLVIARSLMNACRMADMIFSTSGLQILPAAVNSVNSWYGSFRRRGAPGSARVTRHNKRQLLSCMQLYCCQNACEISQYKSYSAVSRNEKRCFVSRHSFRNYPRACAWDALSPHLIALALQMINTVWKMNRTWDVCEEFVQGVAAAVGHKHSNRLKWANNCKSLYGCEVNELHIYVVSPISVWCQRRPMVIDFELERKQCHHRHVHGPACAHGWWPHWPNNMVHRVESWSKGKQCKLMYSLGTKMRIRWPYWTWNKKSWRVKNAPTFEAIPSLTLGYLPWVTFSGFYS